MVSLFVVTACGKKGPPLPPLVKLPAAPSDLTAARRADEVELQFTVPNANTDNTRPANVARVDVYAFTGPATVTDAEVLEQGTRVATIAVKAPRDPNATFDPDDPNQSEADVDPPEGQGLDQGALARVQETLTSATSTTLAVGAEPAVRTYIGVGITTKGRPGPSSRRATVPLVAPPPTPQRPEVTYTETAITLSWLPGVPMAQGAASHIVYELAGASQTQLTTKPIAGTEYVDSRMNWGAMRCYGVRSIETVDGLTVESEASEPACVTLNDTFPPAAPRGLQAVATEGVISLIWEANTEADFEGYILLRAPAPGDELMPVMAAPIRETAYQDRVQPGVPYVYALQSVDRFGNLSPFSERAEETAR